jgi:hypothetical protein
MVWRQRQDRAASVDAYLFPSSVRQRFGLEHRELSAADIATVEAATRQWFRLAARHPKVKLSMPSVIVDDLWHEWVLHTRDYAEFCDAALGRFLHHVPESAMSVTDAVDNRNSGLQTTLRLAQQDECIGATALPLLFRVDRDLGVEGGRRYLADCGGRGQCHELPGAVCVQHLTGTGRKPRGNWTFRGGPPVDSGMAASGDIGGCGGGGCGGGN